MPGWTSYRGLQVPDDTPTGAAGAALKDNLTQLVDWSPKSNYSASSDPSASNDVSEDYYPGSLWLNTSSGVWFICSSNGSGAAVWKQLSFFPVYGTDVVMLADGGGNPTASTVTTTELGYLSGASSNLQSQISANASAVYTAQSTADSAQSNSATAYDAAVAAAASAATADSNAGSAASAAAAANAAIAALAPVASSGAYSSLTGTPTIPSATSQLTNDSGFMSGSSNLSDLGYLPTARYNLFGGNNPVADGTYTVGIGTTQNGTITIVNGLITAIQQAI